MAVLVIKIEVDVNPALVDPHEVADELMTDDDGDPTDYAGCETSRLSAEWEK